MTERLSLIMAFMIDQLFSDNLRILKIAILAFVLLGLVLYAQIAGPKKVPGFREFKADPQLYINQEIEFGGKIKQVQKDRFVASLNLDSKTFTLTMTGELKNAKVNDTIYGVFILNNKEELVLKRYIISNHRWLKILASFIALLWVCYLFLHDFKFDIKKAVFKEI